jgi:hypothetical protein
MASFDLPETPQPRVSPALLVGVASPLWSFFGAAAAGGMAYWWMTRWARPVNLEALLGKARALPMPLPEPILEPVIEAAEAVAETVVDAQAAVAEAVLEEAPVAVGGEAAPISPVLEAAPEPEPEPVVEPEPEVMFAVAPEPVIDEPAPVATAMAEEPTPKVRAKKAAPPLPETDA